MAESLFTTFRPRSHGFHFVNHFATTVIKIPPLVITSNGRSAGMTFAALDYFHSGIPVPLHTPFDFPDQIPQDGTGLPDYIFLRLWHCLTTNWTTFIQWAQKADHSTWAFGEGVPQLTLQQEIPRLKQALRLGPTPVGLVNARTVWDIGWETDHVVAYGYEDDGRYFKLYIYDNAYPELEGAVIVRDKADENGYAISQKPGLPDVHWRGFFLENYSTMPPPYHDLRVTSGVGVVPATARIGQPFEATYEVVNEGQYSVSLLESVGFLWTGPGGQDLSNLGSRHKDKFAVGESMAVTMQLPFPGPRGEHELHAAVVRSYSDTRVLLYAPPPAHAARFMAKYPARVEPQYEILRQAVEELPDMKPHGFYSVAMRASSVELDPPISYDWQLMGDHPLSLSGNPIEVSLEVGASPGPYTKECPVTVTASGTDGSASADFVIAFPRDAHFEIDFASPYSIAGDRKIVDIYGSGNHIMVVWRVHYSQVLLKLEGMEFFRPFDGLAWSPTPLQVVDDNSAVFGPRGDVIKKAGGRIPGIPGLEALAGQAVPALVKIAVSAKGKDHIGQPVDVHETVEPYEFVTYVETVPEPIREFIPPEWEWDVQWKDGQPGDISVALDRGMEFVRVNGQPLRLPTAETAQDVIRVPAELARELDGAIRLRPSTTVVPHIEHRAAP